MKQDQALDWAAKRLAPDHHPCCTKFVSACAYILISRFGIVSDSESAERGSDWVALFMEDGPRLATGQARLRVESKPFWFLVDLN